MCCAAGRPFCADVLGGLRVLDWHYNGLSKAGIKRPCFSDPCNKSILRLNWTHAWAGCSQRQERMPCGQLPDMPQQSSQGTVFKQQVVNAMNRLYARVCITTDMLLACNPFHVRHSARLVLTKAHFCVIHKYSFTTRHQALWCTSKIHNSLNCCVALLGHACLVFACQERRLDALLDVTTTRTPFTPLAYQALVPAHPLKRLQACSAKLCSDQCGQLAPPVVPMAFSWSTASHTPAAATLGASASSSTARGLH